MKAPLVGLAVHVAAADEREAGALAAAVARLLPAGAVIEERRIAPYRKIEGTYRISMRIAVGGASDYQAIKDAFSPGWPEEGDEGAPWAVWSAGLHGPATIAAATWASIDLFDRSALTQ